MYLKYIMIYYLNLNFSNNNFTVFFQIIIKYLINMHNLEILNKFYVRKYFILTKIY